MSVKQLTLFLAGVVFCKAQLATDAGHKVAQDLQAERYEDARKLAEEALKETPGDARLWTLDALALSRLNQKAEALTALKRALKLSPDYLPALESAAQMEFEAGNEDPTPLLERILKQRPSDETSHAMLAAVAFKKGDCEVARSEYAKGRASAEEYDELKEFGACLVMHKRTQEAVPVYEQLRELQPQNDEALYELATVHFLNGNYPEVIKILSSEKEHNGGSLELEGEAYEALSDAERASAALRRAISINPDEAQYYVDLAYICQAQKDFQRGIGIVNQALQRNVQTASLYVARGVLYSELAEYEKGMADFAAAEELDPYVEVSSEARTLTNLQRNNLGEAEKVARERIRLHPNDAFLHYLLGETLRKKGSAPKSPDFTEAVGALRRAIELDRNLTLARDSLAAMYLESGQIEQSIEQSQAAYRANPQDETALYHLILALRKSGNTDQLPELLRQMALLKKQNRSRDSSERKYAEVSAAPQ